VKKGKNSSLSLRMTERRDGMAERRRGRMPFFCHPEAKLKGLVRRFFPFAYAQGQNDRKEGILRLLTQPQNDNKGIRRCHERSEGMTEK
jgi:hypothetical protein